MNIRWLPCCCERFLGNNCRLWLPWTLVTDRFPRSILSSIIYYKSSAQSNRHSTSSQFLQDIWAATWQNQQNGMCTQQRLRSAWASAQSDQSLRCALTGKLRTQGFFMRTATLIRLVRCPGWFESSLGAHVISLVLSWGGSLNKILGEHQHYQNDLTTCNEIRAIKKIMFT